jgi:type II secretory pathway component PulK
MKMKNRRGFALLSAIWLVVAIAVAAMQLAIESRRSNLAAINLTHSIQGRFAASAAIDLARARADLHIRRSAESGPYEARMALSDAWLGIDSLVTGFDDIGGVQVETWVTSLGARMNVNTASERDIMNFLLAIGVDYSASEELSQSILDWRDTDDSYRANGAERDFYIAEGRMNLPRNNLFESVAELRHVNGMTDEIFELVQPFVTVWGSGRINLNTADRPVLMSLTGMTESAVSFILNLRQNSERLTNVNQLSAYLGGANLPNNRTALIVDELEIESLAYTADGRPLLRGLAVVRRGNTNGLSTLTNWRVV